MARPRIKLDKVGIRQLMSTREVADEVQSVAERVAAAAGPEFEARRWVRPTKAVSNVVDPRDGALFREASEGNLARAVGRSS